MQTLVNSSLRSLGQSFATFAVKIFKKLASRETSKSWQTRGLRPADQLNLFSG